MHKHRHTQTHTENTTHHTYRNTNVHRHTRARESAHTRITHTHAPNQHIDRQHAPRSQTQGRACKRIEQAGNKTCVFLSVHVCMRVVCPRGGCHMECQNIMSCAACLRPREVAVLRVHAASQHLAVQSAELRGAIAEGHNLSGAHEREVQLRRAREEGQQRSFCFRATAAHRVKEEDDILPRIVRQRDGLEVITDERSGTELGRSATHKRRRHGCRKRERSRRDASPTGITCHGRIECAKVSLSPRTGLAQTCKRTETVHPIPIHIVIVIGTGRYHTAVEIPIE